ncbi:pyruvate oxidase [Lactococcus sp. DD01]|uniref:pyruvate oxidase n=1 Tax=Lactococcus sp. DD01 TaxID=1776443 RepID=UPI0007763A50|nr:pyruvate oxidase [Lactococcus sp. DD01]KXT62638.1 Pyruvate oxidase [Lactococcus sp. DD01]
MVETIKAGVAAVKVLENWGVKDIYGLPGGSINSLMDALLEEKERIHFVQVRHEEVGAMAASMHAKFTGHIGVAFGSAGPGGTHLMNGLYDAKEDHVPLLAIIGQFGTTGMNMDTFQEMNEDPIYADVSVYHRVVMTAQSLPHIIDEAIRQAYSKKGVAVVQLPVDLGWQEIEKDSWFDASQAYIQPELAEPKQEAIEQAMQILQNAERPVIFSGIGMRGAGTELMELSRKIKAPAMVSALAIDIVDDDFEAFLGSPTRVSRKPANDAIANADTVLMLGTNQPFIDVTNMFEHVKHVIQVDIDPAKLGKRQRTELSILADAKKVVKALSQQMKEKEETPWWRANVKNIANWKNYTQTLEEDKENPLNLYQVYHAINKVAKKDALFSTDVGDVTMTSVRHLHMGKGQLWRTSGLFATMGVGIPGAIAAKLDFPNQQFGFIKDEQETTNKGYLGVEFTGINFAKVAEAMGVHGFTVNKVEELDDVFAQAMKLIESGLPVLIDAKITGESPIPVERLQLDPKQYPQETIDAFKERFHAEKLQPFAVYMEEEGLVEAGKATDLGGF